MGEDDDPGSHMMSEVWYSLIPDNRWLLETVRKHIDAGAGLWDLST